MARFTRRSFLRGLTAAGLPAVAGGTLASRAFAQDGDGGGVLARVEACEIRAKSLPGFETADPAHTEFGRLRFRGGLELSSPFKPFGGLSGLVIEPDGSGLLAISDEGNWLSAGVAYVGDAPAGLTDGRMGPLLDAEGKPLALKTQQDAEAVVLIEGTLAEGTVLVGFERQHRLVPYRVTGRQLLGAAGSPLELPRDAREFADNASFEAVAMLRGGPHKGAVLAFAERYTPEAGYHTGWMWIEREPKRLYLQDIEGFDITDAASLDTGDLLILERRFRRAEGVQMRIRLVTAAEVEPDRRMRGEILLQAKGDAFQIDNMESLAVHRDGGGKTVLTLISDDNFNPKRQRTLLLQFTLGPSAP